MAPRRSDAIHLMRSSAGRLEMRRRYSNRLWPVAARVAGAYRMTFGRRIMVVAVIGSVGKTTTMRAVSAALGLKVSRPAFLNANSFAAVGRALLSVPPWRRRAVLEVGIGKHGEMAVQARTVRPNIVVVTGIARDHWQSFGTLEATRDSKADILRTLPRDGVAVVNADDEHVRWMATQTKARVVLVGQAQDAEVRATDVHLNWPHGMAFTVEAGGRRHQVQTNLIGQHMVFPALAAVAVAHICGVPLAEAIGRIEVLEPTPGRMMKMDLPNGAYALRDEFKGSIDPFLAGIEAFEQIPASRHLAVIGEISEQKSNDEYRQLGAMVGAFADEVVFVGSGKHMGTFRSAAKQAGFDGDHIVRARDAHEALTLIRPIVREGDVIFIKGRWQQALGRIGLALAGKDVKCRADPCPFKRMLCDVCPFLGQEFYGLGEYAAVAADRRR
jgi:UDP-N-acetylmuramoyl-tripeptide--D-alanyl-D-alanine ligase